MPAQRGQAASPRAGDFTAMQKQKLEKEAADKRAEEHADDVAAEKAAADAKENSYVDYFAGAGERIPDDDAKVQDDSPSRVVRIKYGIEQMAYGREVVSPDVFDDDGSLVK